MIKANELRLDGKWKPIEGWENYLISEDGRVYSVRRKKLLKVWNKKNEYPRVTIANNGREKTIQIHRVVALTFIPNPLNKKTVNHKDGNKNNCHVSNLEWATMSENQKHAFDNGLATVPYLGFGEDHPTAKLNLVDIEMIRVLLRHDFTQEQIAKRFNIHSAHVSQIKLRKTWKHV